MVFTGEKRALKKPRLEATFYRDLAAVTQLSEVECSMKWERNGQPVRIFMPWLKESEYMG